MPILKVKDLIVHFNAGGSLARAVDGISFNVEEGKTHALVGESGCGKSVTALSIAGLLQRNSVAHRSGKIIYKGRDLAQIHREEYRNYRGAEIAMIFQEPMTALNPVMKVGRQIVEAIAEHPETSLQTKSNVTGSMMRKKALDLMDMTGLKSPDLLFNKYPHELSGGMRQRIMIAMALSCRPGLLIADEPTTALDVTIQAQILSLMDELQKETGTSILLITHDLGVVANNADTMSVLYAGQVVEEGSVRDVFDEPCHPYTEALFNALPARDQGKSSLKPIPGTVPPATAYDNLPSPCRFYERCQYQDDRCFKKSSRPGHNAYCARENTRK